MAAPGQRALARMPCRAHSRAAVRVRARSASLPTLYSAVNGWALTPLSEHTLTMDPPPPSRMTGNARCMDQCAAQKAICRPWAMSSSVLCSSRDIWPPPHALLTSTSRRPNRSTARSTAPSTCSLWVTSATTSAADAPAADSSRSASDPVAGLRSTSTTAAPSAARRRAAARPIPSPAPVTRATRPSSGPAVVVVIRSPPGRPGRPASHPGGPGRAPAPPTRPG